MCSRGAAYEALLNREKRTASTPPEGGQLHTVKNILCCIEEGVARGGVLVEVGVVIRESLAVSLQILLMRFMSTSTPIASE